MSRVNLLITISVLCCGWLLAENPRANYGSSHSADNTTLIRGCLSSSASGYVLMDEPGFDYRLVGNTTQLDKMVGAEIQVRGTETQTPAPDNSIEGKIQVIKVMKLFDSCTVGDVQK